MVSGYYRHALKQGETYSVDVDLRDRNGAIDTTGWSGASSIKTVDGVAPLDNLGVAIAFTVTFPASGTVRFALPSAKTALLPAKRLLYDAKLVDAGGLVSYYLEGDVIVRESITA